jgi:hypothetical protein
MDPNELAAPVPRNPKLIFDPAVESFVDSES